MELFQHFFKFDTTSQILTSQINRVMVCWPLNYLNPNFLTLHVLKPKFLTLNVIPNIFNPKRTLTITPALNLTQPDPKPTPKPDLHPKAKPKPNPKPNSYGELENVEFKILGLKNLGLKEFELKKNYLLLIILK